MTAKGGRRAVANPLELGDAPSHTRDGLEKGRRYAQTATTLGQSGASTDKLCLPSGSGGPFRSNTDGLSHSGLHMELDAYPSDACDLSP